MTAIDGSFADLEAAFQLTCEGAIEDWRQLGFPPSGRAPRIWINMIQNLGAAEAARRLLISGEIQDGFERLIVIGHPEWTIEWEVLNGQWRPLFSEQHREAARWRLRQAGAIPPN
jgi:hypothetical protein